MIKKETLRETVRDYLRDAIIYRKIKPNERLVETRIAKEMGISQAPVREAIRELDLMGFVDTIPYSGSYVHAFTQKDIKDNFRVRTLLESFAIGETIENMNPEVWKEIEQAYFELSRSYQMPDAKRNTELDIEFHHAIIKASKIQMLEKPWQMLNMAQWTFLTKSSIRIQLPDFEKLHEGIYRAIFERDVVEARRLCNEHYELAASVAMDWLDNN